VSRYAVVVFLCVVATVAHGQERAPDLDTRFLPRRHAETNGAILSPRPISYESPLKARLLRLDPVSCSWDDEVTYEVELTNVSTQDVTLPWSVWAPRSPAPEESLNVFPPNGFPFMFLSLQVGDGLGGQLGNVEPLYGSADESASFRLLRPGASVVIRAPTPCQFIGSKAGPMIAPTGTIAVKLFVRVHLLRTFDELGAFTTSNTLPLTVSR